ADLRKDAARLRKVESEHLKILRRSTAKARVRIWTMAEFIEAPMEPIQTILDEIGTVGDRRLTEAPSMVDLTGFGQFLQNLKNQGMHPYLMGDFPVEPGPVNQPRQPRKPYLVR
ncbi:MAG TPA: glycosyl transferase, partial [Roseibacterium sp.]|nr:glycosyl transferase [Roseibacterium sp.]